MMRSKRGLPFGPKPDSVSLALMDAERKISGYFPKEHKSDVIRIMEKSSSILGATAILSADFGTSHMEADEYQSFREDIREWYRCKEWFLYKYGPESCGPNLLLVILSFLGWVIIALLTFKVIGCSS